VEPTLWSRIGGRWILGAAVAAFLIPPLLAGCAAGPTPKPGDFPFHTAAPPLDIHWKLSLDGGVAHADGLVERHHPEVASAKIQMLGLDGSGRVVSFNTPVLVIWGPVWDVEPFTIRLQPRGGEERYEVRVFTFEYREEQIGHDD
jgi:hypothetical protein